MHEFVHDVTSTKYTRANANRFILYQKPLYAACNGQMYNIRFITKRGNEPKKKTLENR